MHSASCVPSLTLAAASCPVVRHATAVNIPGTYYAVDAETEAPMAITCPADTYGPGLKKQRACGEFLLSALP